MNEGIRLGSCLRRSRLFYEGAVMKRLLAMAVFSGAVTCVIGVGAQDNRARKYVPVTDAMLQKPDASDWLMWRRTLDGWGYSPLNQVNRNNVAQLRMVWTRGMATGG